MYHLGILGGGGGGCGVADFIGSDCIIFGLAWNELEKRNVVSGLGMVVVVMVVVWGDFIGSDIRERFESHLSLLAQTSNLLFGNLLNCG